MDCGQGNRQLSGGKNRLLPLALNKLMFLQTVRGLYICKIAFKIVVVAFCI